MTELFNKREETDLRRDLRKRMTEPESRLWMKLRNRSLNGLKFRRQFGISTYVVDFYCSEKRLVIELDGHTHWTDSEKKTDAARQRDIEALGIIVLRYTNVDIMENLEGVLEDILAKTSPRPSFLRRGIKAKGISLSSKKGGMKTGGMSPPSEGGVRGGSS